MRGIILFLFLPLFLHGQGPTQEQIDQVEQAKKLVRKMKGEAFPAFKLTSIDGKEYTSENTKGKYILFNFWFAGCRPCVEELPELNELVEEFRDKEVIFLAPTFNNESIVNRFTERFEFAYQPIPDVKEFCLDLNIRSYPTHFLVDKDGIIRKVIIGYSEVTASTLRKNLNKLLRSE